MPHETEAPTEPRGWLRHLTTERLLELAVEVPIPRRLREEIWAERRRRLYPVMPVRN